MSQPFTRSCSAHRNVIRVKITKNFQKKYLKEIADIVHQTDYSSQIRNISGSPSSKSISEKRPQIYTSSSASTSFERFKPILPEHPNRIIRRMSMDPEKPQARILVKLKKNSPHTRSVAADLHRPPKIPNQVKKNNADAIVPIECIDGVDLFKLDNFQFISEPSEEKFQKTEDHLSEISTSDVAILSQMNDLISEFEKENKEDDLLTERAAKIINAEPESIEEMKKIIELSKAK